MSGRTIKKFRRQVRKQSDKIKLDFLNSVYQEPFKIRFVLAVRILTKFKPKVKK